MNHKNSALLAIDVQVDFMDFAGSALPVPNAGEDTKRLVSFIEKAPLGAVFTSLDSHHAMDISHPGWWKKADGSPVDPFTMISSDDIKNGVYTPRVDPKRSLAYVEALEANGEFKHFIWPEHCLIGSAGQQLNPIYHDALRDWGLKNMKWVNFINKGINPFTEHFGIFRANVPMPEDPNTQVNQGVFQALSTFDEIYLAGQARSHCVANSLKQLLEIAPALAPKLIILEDCMSDVKGLPSDFYDYVQTIYDGALAQGVRVAKSTDI